MVVLLAVLAVNASAQLTDTVDWEKLVQFESGRKGPQFNAPKNLNTLDYDVKYHRLEWQVSPLVRHISGTVTTHFVPQVSGFNQIYFDLHTAMVVSTVQYHGTNCSFTQLPSHELLVSLPTTLPSGVLDSLTISYAGVPPTSGFGSYATQNVCSNTVPAMWTLSEPYGARDWWPCKQDLNDKAESIDIYISTPSAYKGVANGVLMSQTVSGGNTIYHWRHQHPIPAYLVAIAVSNYSVHSASLSLSGGGSIPMVNYLYPCSGTSGTTINSSLQPIMQLFVNLFGDYPFTDEKYGHAQFGWGGGMEHSTVSFMGGFSHLLLAHELAHQWFGDQVTCGSWSDIWLNEGFATYLEGMTYEHGLGTTTWANWKQGKINNVTSSTSGSVWVDDTTSVSRIFDSRLSYNKGSLLLHMLRWKLGDTDFFQGVRNYLNDPSLAYGHAKTPQLKAHLEAASGQSLDEFFADWYYGQGYPNYTVQWSQNGAQLLTVQLFQAPSHPSVSFFNIPVPVRFNGVSQSRTLVFDPSTDGQTFTAQLNFAVTSVEFDPDRWLCAKSSVMFVLPVELTKLTAAWDGQAVQVEWATATETDNRGFEIQRMGENGVAANSWETIGWKDGQGTSQVPSSYQWTDARPHPSTNYYRLRQLDFDDSEAFSTVVGVQVPTEHRDFKLYPNPAQQEVWVEWDLAAENAVVELYDVHGRLMLRQKWPELLRRRQLSLGELPSGVYAVVLRVGGQVWIERFSIGNKH